MSGLIICTKGVELVELGLGLVMVGLGLGLALIG